MLMAFPPLSLMNTKGTDVTIHLFKFIAMLFCYNDEFFLESTAFRSSASGILFSALIHNYYSDGVVYYRVGVVNYHDEVYYCTVGVVRWVMDERRYCVVATAMMKIHLHVWHSCNLHP